MRLLQGLDPASRQNLWSVVRGAKAGRGIILTTHSMEEATVLCDRLGMFVDGTLVCIGNPKELTSRYGGYYVSRGAGWRFEVALCCALAAPTLLCGVGAQAVQPLPAMLLHHPSETPALVLCFPLGSPPRCRCSPSRRRLNRRRRRTLWCAR